LNVVLAIIVEAYAVVKRKNMEVKTMGTDLLEVCYLIEFVEILQCHLALFPRQTCLNSLPTFPISSILHTALPPKLAFIVLVFFCDLSIVSSRMGNIDFLSPCSCACCRFPEIREGESITGFSNPKSWSQIENWKKFYLMQQPNGSFSDFKSKPSGLY
jgi:hypothetical protein